MRRFLPAILLAAVLPSSCALPPREETILLLHTNDIHGHVERIPTLAGLVKAERAKRTDVLWLDAGDAVGGTPVSSVYRGTPVFTAASMAGVDVACLGNHDFDYGWERIAKFREAATYPLLCANARSPAGEPLGDAGWMVFPVDGVRVGVIGVVTEKTPGMTETRGIEGVRFEAARDALRRLVAEVRPKCDVLVALTHVGYDEDVEIARTVKGIDVVVGGHSHTDLPGPVQVGDAIVVQAFCNGERLGRLELTIDLEARRVVRWEGKPIVVDPERQPRDADTARLVAELEARVSKTLDAVVATAARDLDRDELRAMAADAFREALKTDFGFQNEAGVRASIPKGPVTGRRIWEAFPFDGPLVVVKVRGDRLPAGMAKGAAVDPEKLYTVATSSFVAGHLEKHLPGAEPGGEDSGILPRDAFLDWAKRAGTLR
jgi:2',3'-cyclic-nucleotide 2'-phosphodiesterase (5'-nucleotidase family)